MAQVKTAKKSKKNALLEPVETLPRVGPKMRELLHRLNIITVQDLLFTIPIRYENVHSATTQAELKPGSTVSVSGSIMSISSRRAFRRRKLFIVEAVVDTGADTIRVTWFNQPYIAKQIKAGEYLGFTGKITEGPYGLTMTNPSYERLKTGEIATTSAMHAPETVNASEDSTETASAASTSESLLPIYPLTAGISQKFMRMVTRSALTHSRETLRALYSEEFHSRNGVLPLDIALTMMHQPRSKEDAAQGRDRVLFERLLLQQLSVSILKNVQRSERGPEFAFDQDTVKAFVDSLPFTLTNDQRRAAWQILQDTTSSEQMNRLLIGDVGSGKTVVAAIVALNAVRNGYQVALMAPTDILAKQHLATFEKLFAKTDVRLRIVTQDTNREWQREHAKTGTEKSLVEDIIIGTHALIQSSVRFRRLGLAVIDEQHRFGVMQRKRLADHAMLSGKSPHFLSMSATPIPRTLALTLYGDLKLSRIEEMPHGRLPILTRIVSQNSKSLEDLYTDISERAGRGEQTFVLCPLIEDSDTLNVASVESVTAMLQQSSISNLRIASLHGRMKQEDRDRIMQEMKDEKIDILVSTTVIEVGIDIPRATLMVIFNGERFGLAQLHQLRGRVGRSDKQSHCTVITDSTSARVRERLTKFAEIHNGFQLAELDLELRGAGEVYGIRQSGFSEELELALDHPEILQKAHTAAQAITQHPEWMKQHPLVHELVQHSLSRLHFE